MRSAALIRIVTPPAGNTTFQIGGEGGIAGRRRAGLRDRRPDGPRRRGFRRGELVSHGRRRFPSRRSRAGPSISLRTRPGRIASAASCSDRAAGGSPRCGWGGSRRPRQRHGDAAQPHERRHRRGRIRSDQRTDDVCRPPVSQPESLLSDVHRRSTPARTSEMLTSTQTIDGTTTRGVVEAGRGIGRGQILARLSVLTRGRGLRRCASDGDDDAGVARRLAGDRAPGAVRRRCRTIVRLRRRAARVARGADERGFVRSGDRRPRRTRRSSSRARRSLRGIGRDQSPLADAQRARAQFSGGQRADARESELSCPNTPRRPTSGSARRARNGSCRRPGSGPSCTTRSPTSRVSTGALITRERRNAGDAHARGLELDGEVRPTPELRLRVSGAFTDARFRDSLEPALEGNRLPQVPKASGSATIDWLLPHGVMTSVLWHGVTPQFDDDRNQFLLADGLATRSAGDRASRAHPLALRPRERVRQPRGSRPDAARDARARPRRSHRRDLDHEVEPPDPPRPCPEPVEGRRGPVSGAAVVAGVLAVLPSAGAAAACSPRGVPRRRAADAFAR